MKAFEIAGMARRRWRSVWRHVPRFQYGAPPHGGMALRRRSHRHAAGGATNLRESHAFPMNQRRRISDGCAIECRVSEKQLRELHIRLNLPEA